MICKDVLQKQMEGLAVILMAEMAELMEEDIILKNTRKPDDIQVEIDISL
jgi:hypothetical protein